MKKLPSQTKTALRIREQYSFDGWCWMSWDEGLEIHFAIQPIEMCG